jgi:WD40 repeat protein
MEPKIQDPLIPKESAVPDSPIELSGIRYDSLIKEKFNTEKKSVEYLSSVSSVALSIDRKFLINGLYDNTIVVWNLLLQKQEFVLTGHTGDVVAVTISSDANYIVSGSVDNTIRLWNFAERSAEHVFEGHGGSVKSVIITSDNYIISGSRDDTIKIWSIQEKNLQATLIGDSGGINSITITSDKYIVSVSEYKKIMIWNLYTKNKEYELTGHSDIINSVAVSRNNKYIVTGSNDKTVNVWDYSEKKLEITFKGHTDAVNTVAVTEYGNYVYSGSSDKTIKCWSTSDQVLEFTLVWHTDRVHAIALSSDEKFIVSGSKDKTIELWNISKKTQRFTLTGHKRSIMSVIFTPDSKQIISASDDKLVKIWSFAEKREKLNINTGHKDTITSVAVTPDNKFIITSSYDKTLKIWNIAGGKELVTLSRHTSKITSIAISSDGQYIYSGSDDNSIRIWSIPEKKQIDILNSHKVTSIVKFPSQEYLATGSTDYTVKIWSLLEKKDILTLSGHTNIVNCIAVTPDQKFIVSGSSDKTIKLWDISGKREEVTFIGHTDAVSSLIVTPDGKYIISGSNDTYVKIWNILERSEEISFPNFRGINSVNISYDGNTIVAGLQDNTIKVWDFKSNTDKLIVSNQSEVYFNKANASEVPGRSKVLESFAFFTPSSSNNLFDHYNQNLKFFYAILESIFSKNFSTLPPDAYKYFFTEYRYTLTHYLSAIGNENALRETLYQENSLIKVDAFGKSPIFYSILGKHQPCTDMITDYLITLLSDSSSNRSKASFHAIRNDFCLLVSNSPSNIHLLIQSIFTSSSTLFCRIPESLPLAQLNSCFNYLPEDFGDTPDRIATEQIPVVFKTSLLPVASELGCIDTLEFIDAVVNSRNTQIYRTKFIQFYIEILWGSLKKIIAIYTCLTFINIIMLLALFMIDPWNFLTHCLVAGGVGLVNLLLMVWEIVQLKEEGIKYFKNFINFIDVVRPVLVFVWILLRILGFDSLYLYFFVMLFSLIRGLTGFRLFDGTRYYINLILRSLNEIKYFFVLFSYTTFTFGVLFMISNNSQVSFSSLWATPYNLDFGSYDDNTNDLSLSYVVYLVATLINVIIILNLLISILGDSFDQFQLEKTIIDFQEKAGLILEFQNIPFWKNSRYSIPQYLHYCASANEANDDLETWEGRVLYMDRKIEKNFNAVNSSKESIENKIASVETQVQELNQKIEKILAIISK